MCPVCSYPDLEFPAADNTICPSCGTEFELDDMHKTHAELLAEWIAGGCQWWAEEIERCPGWWKRVLDSRRSYYETRKD